MFQRNFYKKFTKITTFALAAALFCNFAAEAGAGIIPVSYFKDWTGKTDFSRPLFLVVKKDGEIRDIGGEKLFTGRFRRPKKRTTEALKVARIKVTAINAFNEATGKVIETSEGGNSFDTSFDKAVENKLQVTVKDEDEPYTSTFVRIRGKYLEKDLTKIVTKVKDEDEKVEFFWLSHRQLEELFITGQTTKTLRGGKTEIIKGPISARLRNILIAAAKKEIYGLDPVIFSNTVVTHLDID
jgi:hypothetical protein